MSFFLFLHYAFFRKFQLSSTHKVYTYLLYIIVSYFSLHISLYKCYILSWDIFSGLAYLFMFSSSSPCVHIHMVVWNIGDIVHNLSMGIWLHLQRYDIWEVFVVFMKLQWVSYEDVTWCLYGLYFYLQIMSVIFYVVSCDMLSCLQHILNWSCWIFEHIWYVYVVW